MNIFGYDKLWGPSHRVVTLFPSLPSALWTQHGYIMQIWPYLAYLGAYLGATNMVKWGIPEKILQSAVQTRWS